MASFLDGLLDSVDAFLAWISGGVLKQTTESYCDLETADSVNTLVAHDGSLLSIVKIEGATGLIGPTEFERFHQGLSMSLSSAMSRSGHAVQVFFNYDNKDVPDLIRHIYRFAEETATRLTLDLTDLFAERIDYMSRYCAHESAFLVLWTRPSLLNPEQLKRSMKDKHKMVVDHKIPPFWRTQNIIAAIADLRNAHDSFVHAITNDLNQLRISTRILEVHEAVHEIRHSVDPEFTARDWRAYLPGDMINGLQIPKRTEDNIADVMWPSLSRQIIPRDAEVLDLRTVRIGDRIFATVFIDLFPKEIKTFMALFQRVLSANIPWRISFLAESESTNSLRFKSIMASILSFTSAQNRLLANASKAIDYIRLNTDDSVVRLRVVAATWAAMGEDALLRTRTAELAKALQGWGSCEVSEVSGDPFAGFMGSALGVTLQSIATPSFAPLSDVIYMLPLIRPASPWQYGALLFRTPDGKPWPFQPGSSEQTTWIDLIYARPGSGKSVLSNALNLALCLSAGITRLPRIAIIDIGPSSSGLISLLKEALPPASRHLVAYHRLRMTPDYAINPFDTQLGCRYPTPQERAFLMNFLMLLATPIGSDRPYDGISDMAGMIVDELYKLLADDGKPYPYAEGVEPLIDGILEEIGFVRDDRSTWWEVTDALFIAGFPHEALLAQRYAMPLLADAASICRSVSIEDLYGEITVPTGEPLIKAFSRMISSAVREYPILSRVTSFDLGDAKVVSLDLDEVAKGGGDAGDRQTAVMYMLARYVLAKNFYLTEENLRDIPDLYRDYHLTRVSELREDPKRLVYDEFHRTRKAQAVRDQVIMDMREGRKWRVQVALLSQSLEDFDAIMIEFATAIYIMEAGPKQAVEKSAEVFGLSETAKMALSQRVHGPRAGGGTFLVQYATKQGMNTQLLTLTLGPIELWAFSTTSEDTLVRNQLYKRIGPTEARRVLATIFPSGTVVKMIERRLQTLKEIEGIIREDMQQGVLQNLIEEILAAYQRDPNFRSLPDTRT